MVDDAQTTIAFAAAADGSLTGRTGVNRYMCQAAVEGESIRLAVGSATTRAAEPPALMNQEAKFLATLDRVRSYRIDENGLLHLIDESGDVLLKSSRMSTSE